jgi:hypothetical protein
MVNQVYLLYLRDSPMHTQDKTLLRLGYPKSVKKERLTLYSSHTLNALAFRSKHIKKLMIQERLKILSLTRTLQATLVFERVDTIRAIVLMVFALMLRLLI